MPSWPSSGRYGDGDIQGKDKTHDEEVDNGKPVTFTVVAVVNGATTRDTFSLVLSDGYRNTGTLLDGTVVGQVC
jgi:hypothetical protein